MKSGLTAAEVIPRARNVTSGGALRCIGATSAGVAVLAASTLTVDHSTEVSTVHQSQRKLFKSGRSRNAPRITASSALTAGLARRATRVSFASVITVRTASGGITEVTAFATAYLWYIKGQEQTENQADRPYRLSDSTNHHLGSTCVK